MPDDQAQRFEPWTPLQVESKLAELMNAVAQAEIRMRDLLQQEADAELAWTRAHVIASTHPECPVPARGGATVAQRDDWIRGMEADEWEALRYSQLNVQMQKRYIARLEQQCSLVQTMSKHVLAAYATAGARETGRY